MESGQPSGLAEAQTSSISPTTIVVYIKSKGPGGDKKIEEPLGTFKLPNRSTKRQEFDPDEPLGSRILAVVSLEGIECTSDYMIKTTQNRLRLWFSQLLQLQNDIRVPDSPFEAWESREDNPGYQWVLVSFAEKMALPLQESYRKACIEKDFNKLLQRVDSFCSMSEAAWLLLAPTILAHRDGFYTLRKLCSVQPEEILWASREIASITDASSDSLGQTGDEPGGSVVERSLASADPQSPRQQREGGRFSSPISVSPGSIREDVSGEDEQGQQQSPMSLSSSSEDEDQKSSCASREVIEVSSGSEQDEVQPQPKRTRLPHHVVTVSSLLRRLTQNQVAEVDTKRNSRQGQKRDVDTFEDQFDRLKAGTMLKDENISSILFSFKPYFPPRVNTYLVADCWLFKPVYYMRLLCGQKRRLPILRRWDRNFTDKVLWPFCIGSHWVLIVFNLPNKTVRIYCSLHLDHDPKVEAIRNVLSYFRRKTKDDYWDPSKWQVQVPKDIAKQSIEGNDCGVFVVLWAVMEALELDKKGLGRVGKVSSVLAYRKKFAYAWINGQRSQSDGEFYEYNLKEAGFLDDETPQPDS